MASFPTIAEAARLIAAKQLSPVELTRGCLDRVKKLDPTLHSFLLVTEDRAMADAKAAEARMMSSTLKGPLDGIPIGHKDIYNTAGIRTTAHSKLLEHNVPTEDSVVVSKWAQAGSVLMGKLATHEFAIGGPSFDLPWPPARNPWNPDHFTAGSSSGTGAAVAAGLVLGGTGSDTGGSIRGPAALCGIAGIKPTYGLSSRRGVLPLSQTLDHTGPMAWTVQDCALLLQAMAGHDPFDPASANRPVANFTADLDKGAKGLRIGVIRHFHEVDHPVSAATKQGIEDALDIFAAQGAEIRDVTVSPMMDYNAPGWVILTAEAYAVHEPWLKERFNDYGELMRDRLAFGALLKASEYVQALRRRRVLCLEMQAAMADLDILITASAPAEAPKINEVPKWAMFEKPNFTMPFNLTGLPALSLCSGYGVGGLPVSMQIIGKPFAEATVFQAGHAYETATTWRSKRPAMSTALAT
ncbi:MAG: amidase [Acetobacteraceae bacterium]|jgi:aspartyl-tRNA(Asn)/glutamyl-tRNA(Gln) amidotransferase subunit A|nr:amidase family protein [Rhodopila sp.]MEA2726051.1 amidase [Acetobacteraceae bacterium]